MLENEPNEHTEAADSAAATSQQPTTTTAAAKKTTRKRATKKAAAAAVSTPAAETSDPPAAKKTAAKRTAKKAAAKAPAKKTAVKRTVKKTAAAQDTLLDTDDAGTSADLTAGDSQADAGLVTDAPPVTDSTPVTEAAADSAPAARTARTAKKTTRKRTAKKAAAPQPDLLTPADASAEDEELTEEELAAAQLAESLATSATTDQTGSASTGHAADAAEEAPATGRRTRRRAPAAAAVLFQAPQVPAQAKAQTPAQTQAPARAAATSPVEATAEEADEQPTTTTTSRRRRSRRSRDAEETADRTDQAQPAGSETTHTKTTHAKAADGRAADAKTADAKTAEAKAADEATEADVEIDAEGEGEETADGSRRRRRRRGGRRRRKNGDVDGADETAEDEADADSADQDNAAEDQDEAEDAESEDEAAEGEGSSSTSRRRRRRRRRKGEADAGAPDDPDETVVRVREPRSKATTNEITAVEGSTRLEAKKQRRREGRAAGRRRAPIVTEAEFLARRESVERTMVIRSREDLTQIAVSEDNVLVEHYVAQAEQTSLIGNVYLGRVQNVLPSMEAAFIDIGKGRNAVLYAGEVDWNTLGAGNGPRKIESVLKSGQSVLVQVTKDPIGHKGARLTNQVSLPGRYVVYVPRGGNGGISRKLPDTERNRLKTILKDIVPDEAGVIVRTAAEGASEDELTMDVSRLQKYWDDIEKKSKNGQSPQLLYGEPDLLIRVVRDLFTEDFAKLVISGDDAYDKVREYVEGVAPHLADRVEKWTGGSDVFASYRIDEQIKKALDRKVWLPSGGSLVIDRTEAMTVVDVNTGKFTGSGGNLEETVTKNNLEAAEEIVRQLRLRDIGGIIVIDFIDMVLESNRDLVLRRLVECLGRDRTKHQVAEVTSLGLIQMTRKRIGTGLLEAFSENCDHCGGRGLILHDEPKESRRRGGDGRTGQPEQKPAAEGEARKSSSSRRNRGKGRGRDDEHAETPEPAHNADAAQRLAQIAAASALANGTGDSREPADSEPVVHPEPHAEPQPEAHAEPQAEVQAEPQTTTRRRRSSRSRAKATESAGSDAGGNGADAAASAPELVSTGN